MVITGKVVREVDINCGGNFLHQFFSHKPHEMAIIAPDTVHRVDLVSGRWGAPGSVISCHFIHDEKINSVKDFIKVDDEKIVFKVIEGDVLQVYNALSFSIHMEEAEDKQSGVWSVNFEKANASIPDPTPYLDLLCGFTKDMNAYILKQANA
ncbi:kirola-like [Cynara cardunculus var. scolymus]|uniref:kirola-like n=1 Tax=Cynara cardunculus var. scolymus TaxID=59895 RepID=UPI000D627F45|nr:kirola-like [Cynara cardunculus var. scolymus]